MGDCVFCAILSDQAPAVLVTSNPDGVAFLDTRPVFPGHVLVIPWQHVVTLGDLPEPQLAGYFALVRQLSVAVETGLDAGGTFVAMNNRVSQSVPHLHTHIVPRTRGDGLRGFFWPRTRYADDLDAESYADRIRAALKE